jgi:hypothetical protein
MALPLNVYKTITAIATTNPVGIYTAPVGYSSVVLLAQVSNISQFDTYTVNFAHTRRTLGIAVTTELAPNMPIPASDSLPLVSGKLILQASDSITFSSNDSGNNIKLVLSVLETLN